MNSPTTGVDLDLAIAMYNASGLSARDAQLCYSAIAEGWDKDRADKAAMAAHDMLEQEIARTVSEASARTGRGLQAVL